MDDVKAAIFDLDGVIVDTAKFAAEELARYIRIINEDKIGEVQVL